MFYEDFITANKDWIEETFNKIDILGDLSVYSSPCDDISNTTIVLSSILLNREYLWFFKLILQNKRNIL